MKDDARDKKFWWLCFRIFESLGMVILFILLLAGNIGLNYAPATLPRIIWWQNTILLPTVFVTCTAALVSLYKMR